MGMKLLKVGLQVQVISLLQEKTYEYHGPTMVFNQDKELILITGSPGGSNIPAAILRVINGVVDFDLDIGEATMLPRVHKDWPYTRLDYEKL